MYIFKGDNIRYYYYIWLWYKYKKLKPYYLFNILYNYISYYFNKLYINIFIGIKFKIGCGKK